MQRSRSVTAVTRVMAEAARRWLQVLLLLSLLASSGCAWLDARQRQLIYRPTLGTPAQLTDLRAGDEHYFIDMPAQGPTANNAQRIELWWLPHPDTEAPTLLYLHGTFRTLPQNGTKIEALREAGFAVLAVEYRGWGLSTAITPSEQSLLQDADAVWAELERREPRASRRVIYGHSMGSGIAVDLASRLRAPQDYGALILESAFTSFADVASEASFVASLLLQFNNERFASIDKIARVHAPLLMIHGSADTTIPMRLGRRLYAAANPPKRWLAIEGGAHSDLQDVGRGPYQATLRHFKSDYLSGPIAQSHGEPTAPAAAALMRTQCPASPAPAPLAHWPHCHQ
ncbi:MAG: alpha/beta hydrolase [Rhodoferax sp.]|nr:alpha/beta hydrolase [Rhodoferax sp.]